MRRRPLLIPVLLASACSSSQGSALRVTLDFAASAAQCARVVVTGRTSIQTGALARSVQPRVVGVAPTYALGNPVTVEAFGWASTDCTGALLGAARPVDVAFPAEGVAEVALTLSDFAADGGTGGGAGGGGGTGGTGGGTGGTGGGSAGDGGTDGGAVDAGRVEFSYTPTNFNPAIDPALTAGNIVLNCGTSTFNSTTNAFTNWCGQATPTPVVVTRAFADDVVVLPMRGLVVGSTATLKITGDKGVILAVYGDADVQGLINGDAERDVAGPGGSKAINCLISTGSSGVFLAGAGGGGAGHLNAGSVGGFGPGQLLSFGIGGAASGATFPDPLRGGCSGGAGGIRAAGDVGAPPGAGGGAIQVSAARLLRVSGIVSAAGGGGRGAKARKGGGGGGGSGGGILLEAPTVTLSGNALLLANGGAGGGGADDNTDGLDGDNGRNDSTSMAQGGNSGGGDGGKGGDGESAQGADTQGEDSQGNNGGGGGGGAAAGRIHLRGVNACTKAPGVLVSPSFTGACP